jgi:hypothetical protein
LAADYFLAQNVIKPGFDCAIFLSSPHTARTNLTKETSTFPQTLLAGATTAQGQRLTITKFSFVHLSPGTAGTRQVDYSMKLFAIGNPR